MRQLSDILELEKEVEGYRDVMFILKNEVGRIRKEYLDGALSLSESAINEVDEELETVSLLIENTLFS